MPHNATNDRSSSPSLDDLVSLREVSTVSSLSPSHLRLLVGRGGQSQTMCLDTQTKACGIAVERGFGSIRWNGGLDKFPIRRCQDMRPRHSLACGEYYQGIVIVVKMVLDADHLNIASQIGACYPVTWFSPEGHLLAPVCVLTSGWT